MLKRWHNGTEGGETAIVTNVSLMCQFDTMESLKRFKMINRCIRFDDKADRQQRSSRDKLCPVRVIFDKWVQRCKALYNPGHCVTIDEQLIPFRGLCPFTQYIPSKPYKYGIKMWVLCDSESYYAYNMDVYTGRDRNCHPEVKQGQRVILQLAEGLKGRNITTDNFFTSFELGNELKKRDMTLVGTIRKNRKELPPALIDMKKEPLYHSEFAFDHQSKTTLVSYVPKRRKYVTLLSTYHTNATISAEEHKKPEIILFYNSTKSGVDVLDELVDTYRCKRKTNRWPLAVFANMLDISAYNAYVIFIHMNPLWNYTKKNCRQRLFLIEIGNSLVTPYIATRTRIPRSSNPAAIVHSVHSARCDKCKKAVCAQHRFTLCEKCEAEMSKTV